MAKLLQSPWTVSVLALLLYAGSTFYFWQTPSLPVPARPAAFDPLNPTATAPRVEHGPSWEFSNPEVDLLVRELRQERAALAARAKQLDDLAARLQAEQAELQQATQAVFRLQQDFDRSVIRLQENETVNLKRLARVYGSMEPDGATAILKQLDEATIVKVMSFMKDDKIANLLTSLARAGDAEAKRVAVISERLRLLQSANASPKPRP